MISQIVAYILMFVCVPLCVCMYDVYIYVCMYVCMFAHDYHLRICVHT